MNKKIYLTIDDAPSKHTKKKVAFLQEHNIPAIFFCRGESMPNYKESLIFAIKNGYHLGNHSYSHPHFSKITYEQAVQEILKTEKLIDECYQLSGVKRPYKVIRFPFGDRGNNDTINRLQDFLQEQGFVQLDLGQSNADSNYIDAQWTWDTADYKRSLMEDSDLYLKNFSTFFRKSKNDAEVILLHDFEENHHLFVLSMNFLLKKEVIFLPITIIK